MRALIRLSEGVIHLEDLPIDEFISTLNNMSGMEGQEKLDGSQLWVGIDAEGKLFTSREGKRSNAERRYAVADWPEISDFNQFRAAHEALVSKEAELKRIMRPGDTVEVEVLFGRQPNSVTYGADDKSYIAFLRAVDNTPEVIVSHLSAALANQQVNVKVDLVDTADGKDLSNRTTDVQFQFTSPMKIDTAKLKTAAGVDGLLKKLQAFLEEPSSVPKYTNQQLATLALSGVQKDERETVKQARTELLDTLQTRYKLPIKNAILAKAERKSNLSADDITPDEDISPEGIVLRDPSSGEQIKIVDKDVFSAINQFNQKLRGEIQSALNTTDPDAPLESRGGILGELRIAIAAALGNRELAKASNVRKLLKPIKGDSPEAAIKNLAASLNITDFIGVKKKILALAAETAKALDAKLAWFNDNKDTYKLTLKNGREIGLSAETVKKTLLTFAEARRNLVELFNKIKLTKTPAELLAVLYGSSAKAVHAGGLTEAMLTEKRKLRTGEMSLSEFDKKDTFTLVHSYVITALMTMVIYHTLDTIGMRYLRDRRNATLKVHDDDMSPFNHWGYAVWRAGKPDMKKRLSKVTVQEITAATKKIPAPFWKFMHRDFSFNNEIDIDWPGHTRTLDLLMRFTGVRSERLNTMLDLSARFDKLDLTEQKHVIRLLLSYGQRFITNSRLLSRIRVIGNKLKDSKEPIVVEGLLREIAALSEEGEGPGAAVDLTQNGAVSGTLAGAVGALPVKLIGGTRRTEMRKRNPDIKLRRALLKFKDPRKIT